MACRHFFPHNAPMSPASDTSAQRHSSASNWITFAKLAGMMALAILALPACGPDYNAIANRLRTENLQQKNQIAGLNDSLRNKDATITDLQSRLNGNLPPLQTLPPDRLAQVFTAARLEIQSSSDTYDPDGKGLSAFRIFLRTYTNDGQIAPASGTLTVEAFELPAAPTEPRRLGTWTFTPQEMKKNWYTGLGLNHFALTCPWQTHPTQDAIVFKARLQDALTGMTLQAQLDKKISLPAPMPAK